MDNFKFPHIHKSIDDFLSDEEGNIPMNKVLTIGSMIMILGILFAEDVFSAHSSHRSHSSHSSHSSGGGGYGHSSHVSHTSHQSGVSDGNYSSNGAGSSAATAQAHTSHNNVAPDASTMSNMHTIIQSDNADISIINNVVQSPEDVPSTTGGINR